MAFLMSTILGNQPLLVLLFIGLFFLFFFLINRTVKQQFHLLLKPFHSRILLEGLIFVGLLLLRWLLSIDGQLYFNHQLLDKGLNILIFVMLYRLISLFLEIVDASYAQSKLSLRKPLKPLIQAIRIFLFIVLVFGLVAIILDKDPFIVMGSVSTLVAFLSFIFKDLVIGFFAGIQLTANDIIRIGDFIKVTQLGLSGVVKNIGLTTVSLEAIDQTELTVGTYLLLQNPIINYRQLADVTGRQFVKRFNFKPHSEMKIRECVDDILCLLQQHPNINADKLISCQIEEGTMNNLVLSISCFSTYREYADFDRFSHELSIEILEKLVHYQLF